MAHRNNPGEAGGRRKVGRDRGSPSAGKTPEGTRGAKPSKHEARVQTSGGAWMWKAIAATFGSGKKKR